MSHISIFPFDAVIIFGRRSQTIGFLQALVNHVGTWFKDFVASQGYSKPAFVYQLALKIEHIAGQNMSYYCMIF